MIKKISNYLLDQRKSAFYSFQLEPNPFIHAIRLSTPGAFRYSIYNLDGRLSEFGNGIAGKEIGTDLIPGMYILKIGIDNQEYNSKIIKI